MELANAYGMTCLAGLGAPPAAARQQRQQAAALKRQQRQQAAQAKRQLRIQGRNVNISAGSAGAAQKVNSEIARFASEGKAVISEVQAATTALAQANAAARRRPAPRPVVRPGQRPLTSPFNFRGLGAAAPVRRPAPVRYAPTGAQQSGIARAKRAIARATAFTAKIRSAHGGIKPTTVTARGIRPGMRGLGYVDPVTGFDDGQGDPSMMVDPGYVDPGVYSDPGGYYPPPYVDQGFQQQPMLPPALDTGLTPGFGLPFMMQSSMPQPAGCRTGSNLPRCLIFEMAQQDRQQMMFVFTILQQMYGQLLQIVQQLMVQLQQAQQQPAPYYGPQTPYGQYGQQPYPPYGADPYGQYGGYGGQYGGGYGYPGIPYAPGGDSSLIPPGYDGGGGPFDAGSMIPSDITQTFPGPGGAFPIPSGAQAPTPGQPNIISSDSLPDGSGPGTTEAYGSEETPVPAFTPAPSVAVAKTQPAPQTVSQAVSMGPDTPYVITQPDSAGQSPYADAGLPAGASQDQPSLEPPSQIESWASDDWA